MWELDCEENWTLKNWCFWTVVLEKTLYSPLDCKDIQPVHPKGDQSCVFVGRTAVEAETPIFWPPDAKSWLIWKDPNAGKDWEQEEKCMTEDEMAGWRHWLNGHVCVCEVLSRVQLFATPWTIACQAPLSVGFFRQEYWSGLPSPSPWVWVNSWSWWWTGGLVYCGSWCCKESDMTEWLNWIELILIISYVGKFALICPQNSESFCSWL